MIAMVTKIRPYEDQVKEMKLTIKNPTKSLKVKDAQIATLISLLEALNPLADSILKIISSSKEKTSES